jgi:hypothetical protein
LAPTLASGPTVIRSRGVPRRRNNPPRLAATVPLTRLHLGAHCRVLAEARQSCRRRTTFLRFAGISVGAATSLPCPCGVTFLRPRGDDLWREDVESLSRESLSLLGSLESAISKLQSLHEPRLDGVISRLERRRAEIVAALGSKGHPEQQRRRGARGSPS